VFKYTRRKTAIRVFSGIYIKESIVKNTKIAHRIIKAKYKFNISLFGLLERYITPHIADKYETKMSWVAAGNITKEISNPIKDNQLFFKVLIVSSSIFFYGADYKNLCP
jgi:hypothetical protein|tara:strand:+ start:816 stop:1142 length:327 start_codon:yes stop_codon:yes gene_type:complete